ncbi:MAG: nucleotidyltransferase family protein [Desulfuromonadales bacterium]
MTKEEILAYLISNKQVLAQQYGVITIGLFGSYARNEAREDSDLDIAIEMAPEKKSLRNFLGLKRTLENHFGKTVDLGIESTLKPLVRERVKKEILYV